MDALTIERHKDVLKNHRHSREESEKQRNAQTDRQKGSERQREDRPGMQCNEITTIGGTEECGRTSEVDEFSADRGRTYAATAHVGPQSQHTGYAGIIKEWGGLIQTAVAAGWTDSGPTAPGEQRGPSA